jgi:hypothetical protein
MSACLGMKNRLIAAVVVALLSWQSVGAVVASPLRPGISTTGTAANQTPSRVHGHSCCPHIQIRFAPPLFVMPAPAAMPCGEQHPCCARQGHENPQSLPAASTSSRPDGNGVSIPIADQRRDNRTRTAAEVEGSNPFQSYCTRSTVLRI